MSSSVAFRSFCAEKRTEEKTEEKTEVKKVKVGAGNSYSPYCYIDEENNHTGFDVDLLKAVDEYLEDYEFDIEASAINDLLAGLDAGNYAFISHVLTKTPEREEKYLFGQENTGYKNFWILAKKDSDINTFEDLVGKTFLDKPGKGRNTGYLAIPNRMRIMMLRWRNGTGGSMAGRSGVNGTQ